MMQGRTVDLHLRLRAGRMAVEQGSCLEQRTQMPSVLLQHARNELDFLSRLVSEPKLNGSAQIEGPPRLVRAEYGDLISLLLEFPHTYEQTVESEIQRVFTDRSRTIEQLREARAELEKLADEYTAWLEGCKLTPIFANLLCIILVFRKPL
jgi:hypothetical protein